MYIVLGVLYESFIHPITILRRRRRRHGALLALMVAGDDPARRDHRHHPADGTVRKMRSMVDFA
jgi:hypothetical protein